MKILIVEDDNVSSMLLGAILSPYGQCTVAATGSTGIALFKNALASHAPYALVCLDIMLPEVDGQCVLKELRFLEKQQGIGGLDGAKIVMITALGDRRNIMDAFTSQCEGYIVKPIRKDKVVKQLNDLGIERPAAYRAGEAH